MGTVKKAALILLAAGMLTTFSAADVSAADMTKAYNLEQAQGKAPTVKAYMNGKKVNGKNEISAQLSGSDLKEELEMKKKSVRKFAKTGEGIRYVILLDNSLSVSASQFAQAKAELVRLRRQMGEKDQMLLYTVGSDRARGEKKCVVKVTGKTAGKATGKTAGKATGKTAGKATGKTAGKATGKTAGKAAGKTAGKAEKAAEEAEKAKQIQAIQGISRSKYKTVLYRSLGQVIETIDNSKIRTVIILITDGEDDSQGKNNRSYQVNPAVRQSKAPIYGLLLENVSSSPNSEKIRNTRKNILNERVSRGYYEDCGSAWDVKKGFASIREILYQKTWVVTLEESSHSNRTTMEASLRVLCDGEETKLSNGMFSYNDREKDNVPPEIKNIKKTGEDAIQFTIQDDKTKKILGADKKENYIVKDADGRDWKVEKVNVNQVDGTYELIFEEELFTGDYTLQCSNITDDTHEKNKIKKEYAFSIKGLSAGREIAKRAIQSYWWIGLILLVALIGGTAIILIRKKAIQAAEVNPETLVQADTRRIRLTITDRAGTVKDVEWNVEGSIFVGRSDICNIYFDDDRLSRQHFAIEVTKVACYIEDLETTNATFVNGVKITGRRMLLDGDVITAGREKFVFHTVSDGGEQQ